jgi:N6-adenosine-specific RNA methylase IME4
MDKRVGGATVGAGITAFLVVSVAVIEFVNVEFSALLGLPAGLLAGATVAVVVAAQYDTLADPVRYAVDAATGFGFAVVTLLAVRYVNLAGLRTELSTGVTVGIALLAAVLAALASWRTGY